MERCEIGHVLTICNCKCAILFLLFALWLCLSFVSGVQFLFLFFFCDFSNLFLGPATYCALKCLPVIYFASIICESLSVLSLLPCCRGTQRQFSENICSEEDLRSRTFGTFVVKVRACLPVQGFSIS